MVERKYIIRHERFDEAEGPRGMTECESDGFSRASLSTLAFPGADSVSISGAKEEE